ncbi:MDR family MFS transporter [Salinactinospora qingdaonensis]|uniref:MDR family MFS transporter n=2 Tax=Salinactinospora qingdaonensis TaxID=702744 RepID=A0ABP7G8D2_9ACTN
MVISLLTVAFLGALDHTVVATSLATIAGELDALPQMSWVIVAYTLASTVVLPVAGKLGDIMSARRVYLASVAVFVIASLACGFAQSMSGLVVARVAQGAGTAGIQLTAQTLVAGVAPPRRRPRYLSVIGAAFPIAIVVGPVLGGVITDTLGWRWVFWINVPLGIAALLIATVAIPTLRPLAQRRFDLLGALTFAVTVVPLVLAVSWLGDAGRLTPPVLTAAAVSVAALGIFLVVEARAVEPLVPPHFFGNRTVVCCLVLSAAIGVGLFSVVSYVPTYVQMVFQTSVTVSGVVPIATVLGMLVASLTTGWLAGRSGRYRTFVIAGPTMAALGLLGMAQLPAGLPLWVPMALMALVGLGTGSYMNLIVAVIQSSVAPSETGTATSTVNLVRQVGVAVAAAVVGAVIGAGAATTLPASLKPTSLTPEAVRALAPELRAEVADAYATVFSPIFLCLAMTFVLAAVAAALMPAGRLPDDEGTGFEEPASAKDPTP